MTLKTGVMMLELNRNNLHFNIYNNGKQLLGIVIIFHNIAV